jgi:hypothetical protein
LLQHVVEIWPQKTQKIGIWQIWVMFSQKILCIHQNPIFQVLKMLKFSKKETMFGIFGSYVILSSHATIVHFSNY